MVLGLFLAAFGGMAADATNHIRPDTATHTGASGSEIAHVSKREPSRIVVADIRRDGVPASTFDDGDGCLPPSATGPRPIVVSDGFRHAAAGQTAGTGASSFHPRAPPAAA